MESTMDILCQGCIRDGLPVDEACSGYIRDTSQPGNACFCSSQDASHRPEDHVPSQSEPPPPLFPPRGGHSVTRCSSFIVPTGAAMHYRSPCARQSCGKPYQSHRVLEAPVPPAAASLFTGTTSIPPFPPASSTARGFNAPHSRLSGATANPFPVTARLQNTNQRRLDHAQMSLPHHQLPSSMRDPFSARGASATRTPRRPFNQPTSSVAATARSTPSAVTLKFLLWPVPIAWDRSQMVDEFGTDLAQELWETGGQLKVLDSRLYELAGRAERVGGLVSVTYSGVSTENVHAQTTDAITQHLSMTNVQFPPSTIPDDHRPPFVMVKFGRKPGVGRPRAWDAHPSFESPSSFTLKALLAIASQAEVTTHAGRPHTVIVVPRGFPTQTDPLGDAPDIEHRCLMPRMLYDHAEPQAPVNPDAPFADDRCTIFCPIPACSPCTAARPRNPLSVPQPTLHPMSSALAASTSQGVASSTSSLIDAGLNRPAHQLPEIHPTLRGIAHDDFNASPPTVPQVRSRDDLEDNDASSHAEALRIHYELNPGMEILDSPPTSPPRARRRIEPTSFAPSMPIVQSQSDFKSFISQTVSAPAHQRYLSLDARTSDSNVAAKDLINFLAVHNGGSANDFPFSSLISPTGLRSPGSIYAGSGGQDRFFVGPSVGPGVFKTVLDSALSIALSNKRFWTETSVTNKVTLNSDEDGCWSASDFILVSAFGTLVGLSLVRRNAIPALLSPCFLLAAVDGANALDNPEAIKALMPDLHEQLLPFPCTIDRENGPLFNSNHPDFCGVGALLGIHLDIDRARLTPDMEDTQLLQFRKRLVMTAVLRASVSAEEYARRGIVKAFLRGLNQTLNEDTGVKLLDPFVGSERSMRSLVEALAISTTPTWKDAEERTDYVSALGGSSLTPDEVLWAQAHKRWMKGVGILQHPVLRAINSIEAVRLREQDPNFRAVSFFKYLTGEEYFLPREEGRITLTFELLNDYLPSSEPASTPSALEGALPSSISQEAYSIVTPPRVMPPVNTHTCYGSATVPLTPYIIELLCSEAHLNEDSTTVTHFDLYLHSQFANHDELAANELNRI